MEHLNNTLFLHIVESGQTYWTYKHPTIADAYAELISEQPELIEIYLRGAKLASILYEVVYGTRSVKGAKLRVPRKLFDVLALRLAEAEPRQACLFLLSRVDAEFRKRYLKQHPNLMRGAITFRNPLVRDPHSQFFVTANRECLLSDEDKARVVRQLKQEVIDYGDVTFLLNDEYISFLGEAAYAELLDAARMELAPRFADLITDLAEDCDTDDPEGYFEGSTEALNALEILFPDDVEVRLCVEAATSVIDDKVGEVKESPAEENDDELAMREQEQYLGARYQASSSSKEESSADEAKSVFEDIDDDEDD
jgi:hypothetical protein